jgi:hypothetical protein
MAGVQLGSTVPPPPRFVPYNGPSSCTSLNSGRMQEPVQNSRLIDTCARRSSTREKRRMAHAAAETEDATHGPYVWNFSIGLEV